MTGVNSTVVNVGAPFNEVEYRLHRRLRTVDLLGMAGSRVKPAVKFDLPEEVDLSDCQAVVNALMAAIYLTIRLGSRKRSKRHTAYRRIMRAVCEPRDSARETAA